MKKWLSIRLIGNYIENCLSSHMLPIQTPIIKTHTIHVTMSKIVQITLKNHRSQQLQREQA